MGQSNGGVSQSSRLTLYPMQGVQSGASGFYAFDPGAGYNDGTIGSFYSFKVEQVIPGRVPTIRKLIVTYRDLGQVMVTFTLSGTTDGQKVVSSTTPPVQLGNAAPTGVLMTVLLDIQLTAMNQQLTITRGVGAGPISIASIVMCGTVEVGQVF